MNDKSALRRAMKARLQTLTPAQREAASRQICARLAAWWKAEAALNARPVAVYEALSDEPQLEAFIAQLRRECHVVAPRVGSEAGDARPLQTLFGAPEGDVLPGEVGLWLVPGLAFDAPGFRLGRGGGWYDRALSRAAPDAFKIGVCFDFQMVPDVPREAHDMSVHCIVTEARLLICDDR